MAFKSTDVLLCRYEVANITIQIDGGSTIKIKPERLKELEIIEK